MNVDRVYKGLLLLLAETGRLALADRQDTPGEESPGNDNCSWAETAAGGHGDHARPQVSGAAKDRRSVWWEENPPLGGSLQAAQLISKTDV